MILRVGKTENFVSEFISYPNEAPNMALETNDKVLNPLLKVYICILFPVLEVNIPPPSPPN